jgi:hypothetical protein
MEGSVLTDEEREAVKYSAGLLIDLFVRNGDESDRQRSSVLRSLLDRLSSRCDVPARV